MRVEKRVETRTSRRAVSLSPAVLDGLYGLHRYRLLSAPQFARLSDLSLAHCRDVLRRMERKGWLGSIGNVGLGGGSKAPKLYYLNRSGFDAMCEAGGFDADTLGRPVRVHTGAQWSPIMAHRMAVIDLLVAVERMVLPHPGYRVVDVFHEYRRVVRRGRRDAQPETSDFVADPAIAENRIVPDAAFVLENVANGTRGLYLIELDRGTERLARGTPEGYSVADKFALYERYLRGGRFAETYEASGTFRFFTLLFVTTLPGRIANLRNLAARFDPDLHSYFRLAAFETAKADPYAAIWHSRDPALPHPTRIIKRA